MHSEPVNLSHDQLQRRREIIRRGLLRVNMAALAIVAVVVTLAIVAIIAGFQAQQNATEAQAATAKAEDQLFNSYIAQTTAGRLSGVMGRKSSGLKTITAAARMHSTLALRNEAIAHSALTDLEDFGVHHQFEGESSCFEFAANLTSYAAMSAIPPELGAAVLVPIAPDAARLEPSSTRR